MSHQEPASALSRRTLLAGVATAALTSQATAQTPRQGGVLVIAQTTEPPALCSAFNSSTYIGLISCKVLEGLVAYDDKQQPLPLLAESWTISPDALTYTFALRQGVKWHDGKPFSSADVAFCARRNLEQAAPAQQRHLGRADGR